VTDNRDGAGNVFPWQIRPSRESEAESEDAPEVAPDEPAEEPEPVEPTNEPEPVAPQPVASEPADATQADEGPPTEAMALSDLGDEGPPTEAMSGAAAPSLEPALPAAGTEKISVPEEHEIDDVFGHDKFTEHEPEPIFVPRPRTAAARAARPPSEPRASFSKNQKIMLWSAGAVLAMLTLLVLFFLGTRLAPVVAPASVATPTPTAEPTPAPTTAAIGPVAPGVYDWTELLGGECLEPFVSPWEEEFTVVDCAQPHAAQLLGGGSFAEAASEAYPGVEALQAQVNLVCTTPTLVNYGAAGAFADIQVSASYAVTEEQWAGGYRGYSCFVNRSSGEPLTGSIAVPPPGP